jgi:hypothetical protein
MSSTARLARRAESNIVLSYLLLVVDSFIALTRPAFEWVTGKLETIPKT